MARHPEQVHKSKVRASMINYGLSFEEVVSLRETTHCECCGDEAELVIDHNHSTGEVRGMLCGPCNKALRFARDDPDRLRLLIKYLKVY